MLHRKRITSVFFNASLRRALPIVVILLIGAVPSHAKVKGSGDFNGDGYDDLCIGVVDYTVGTKTRAGAVNCLYGSPNGLQATGSPAAQLWTQDTDGVQGVSESYDQFGYSLATGDFNGDGFDDLCIGVPYEGVSGKVQAGAVNCLYGSTKGLQATGVGGPPPQIWDEATSGIKGGLKASEVFGVSLIAGDFNHDGYADLCVGVPGMSVNGVWAGEVNCLYGSASGLQANGTGGPADQRWNRATAGIAGGLTDLEEFGSWLVAGDFNGDGFDDICVGAYFDSPHGVNLAGSINCLYGSSTGLQATGTNGAPASQYWYQGYNSMKGTATVGFLFGQVMAVGDFNHDGFADLAVGAPALENYDRGQVNVLYGSSSGLQAAGTGGGPNDQLWSRSSPSVKGGDGEVAFGFALAGGDFNMDGYDDLCIGAPYASDSIEEYGAVNCLYGSPTGLQATGTGGPDDQLWSQGSDGVIGVKENGDFFGHALTAGDFNGDGMQDLAIGVTGENSDAGGVNVLYGYFSGGLQAGLGLGFPDDQFWHQASDGVPGSGGGRFGFSLSH